MSIEITGVTIAHRKKTAAEWSDSEYVLSEAEWGYETDTGKVKIGDGVTPWGGLDYFGGDVDLSGYATEEWVENKEYVSNAQIDTDADLAANSDVSIPSQKAVKAYVDAQVTLKPWTPDTYVSQGIDLITPIDLEGNGLTATLTGSTVSVTGNEETLANGLVSAAGVLSTTQANSLYFKMGASAGAAMLNGAVVGFVDGSDDSTIDNFVQSGVVIVAPATTVVVGNLGNPNAPDHTEYFPALEIPTSSANSEICLSYMPVGGTNGFGYVTLYVDGVQIAQHQFTQAVVVDKVMVTPYVVWDEASPSNSAWIECLSNPTYPIAGLPPLIIGAGSSKLDETAYPTNATSNIFEITGTPTPLQWDALGGTVVDGDLVAFDSAGVPFVVDVSGGGGDVTAAGNNVFTGSNTFVQPIEASQIGSSSGDYSAQLITYTDSDEETSVVYVYATSDESMDNVVSLSLFDEVGQNSLAHLSVTRGGDIKAAINIGYDNVDGKGGVSIEADEIHGLESRVGTFPLAFDIERTYGSKETPLTGNLGWTKSSDDKRVYQEVYHNSATAPTELASMTKVGDGAYIPSETNLIYIWCSLPNATTTADGYFYTVTQV